MSTPAEMLDLIVAKAKDLRAAGVRRVRLEGCEFDLLAHESAEEAQTPDANAASEPVESPVDPLFDAHTFLGRGMPTYQRRNALGR